MQRFCIKNQIQRILSNEIIYHEKDYFSAYAYQINEEIIKKTELKNRLLFKMGGYLSAHITVHKSIASIFRKKI